MNKTVQRIVSFLLVLLVTCGMYPAALATDVAPEDTTTDPTVPTEEAPEEVLTEEPVTADDPTTEPTSEPTESTEPVETTAPVDSTEPAEEMQLTEATEPAVTEPTVEETNPVSDMEEEVTASMAAISSENVPMLMAARAAVKGTHYHRALIWLSSADSKLSFTYNGKDYSVDRLYVHGVISNGSRSVAYCIDPGVITTESSGGYSGSETAWDALDIDTQTAIGLAVLYGAPNGMSSSTKKTMLTYEFATQIIIHEILLGYRSTLPPFECTNDKIITKFGTDADGSTNGKKREITSGSADYSSLHGEYINRTTLRKAYDTIAANMASHYVLPSFASRYDAAAKTYEMTKQSDGTYSVTLTDTNNILSNCTFQNGNGLTYTVSGNQLTITSDGPFDEVKSCALTNGAGVSKNVPNLENETFYVWKSGSYQKLVTLVEPQNDPLPLYFNVTAKEENGVAQIIKKATNGGTVAGWHFTMKDSSGNVVGNYVTDATGVIAVEVEAGTYTISETDGSQKYWVNDPTPAKTVTVKAGETASVTFTNQWRGQAQIIKTTTNGGSVAGWHFTVKDSSGTVVGNYVTDATGVITLDLEPGTYSVTESDGVQEYWHNDPTPTKTVTVKAGQTAKVTFSNQWKGKAQIIKTTTNGGTVEGWHFTVKDSSGTVVGNYVTDSTGVITLDLEPGTYSVTESDGVQEYWHNDPTPTKTVTVKAGQTAKVTFTNQWKGKAKIIKTATNGGTVEGWEFTVTDSKGAVVGTYLTDSTGTITLDLEPGSYTISESDKNDPYWYCDTEPQTVTVKAGETASVTFQNQWIGKAKIIKTLSNPEAGSLEGWTFNIFKYTESGGAASTELIATVTTGADGTILQDLEPGKYQVKEVLEEGSLWECVSDTAPIITVNAGQTAEVTFTNALRPGKISIEKLDFQGKTLSGVEFLLEWSEDGKNWKPVTSTASPYVTKGTCTSAGLENGILATPDSGTVAFTGLHPEMYYRVTEVSTANGKQLMADSVFEGKIPQDNLTVAIRAVDDSAFVLPHTGSREMVFIPLAFMLYGIICYGVITVLIRKKD